jgi:hypothetical protein
MEGDVEAILPRPTLPRTSSNTAEDLEQDSVADQSQIRKEREVKGEVEKWGAWYACAGLSRTEAKRRYVEVLIQTMKIYAAGTAEARELVEELEFVWNQIRSQSGSEEGLRNTARAGAGLAGDGEGAEEDGRLRVLSPVSRGGSGEIIEGEDASIPEREADDDDDDDDDEDELRKALDDSETNPQNPLNRRRQPQPSPRALKWRRQIETALTKISTELAAVREQIEELNTSSYNRSTFNIGRRKGIRRVLAWMRWILWIALRQMALDAVVLGVLLLWGVWRGDDRFEKWARRRWAQLRRLVEGMRLRCIKQWDWAGIVVRVVPARFF